MKKLIIVILVFVIGGNAFGQAAYKICLEKKYGELPFGMRMENSGNYSIASFDIVGDAVYCTNFNDSKSYILSDAKVEVQSASNRMGLDIVGEVTASKSLLETSDGEQDFLWKKIFFNQCRLLKDVGGIVSGESGEVLKVLVENKDKLLIENNLSGLQQEIQLTFPSNLACADLVGIDRVGNSYLVIETYVQQIPLRIKREVYSLSKEGVILSRLELPESNFIYTLKDLQIDAEGNLYHLYSDEVGIKIFKWSGLQKVNANEITYPNKFLKDFSKNRIVKEEAPQYKSPVGINTPASRLAALKIGESYALHQYSCSSQNLAPTNVTAPDGDVVRTPAWLVTGTNARIPYKWGGFNTVSDFDAGIRNGRYCGDINTAGVSSYAVGVDCSGFVSRCWQMSYHSSTSMMPDITTQYANWDMLKPGDAILIPGHVRLFVNRTPNGYFRVVEASARGWDVSYWSYSASSLASYTPRFYNNMETNSNALQPNLLQAIASPENNASLTWTCDTANIIGYRVYHSVNGSTWNLLADESICKSTSFTIATESNIEFFRVASVMKVGDQSVEGNWSNAMGLSKSNDKKCLIVDGFNRNTLSGSWEGPGHTFSIKYGKALTAVSKAFETVSNTKLLDSSVALNNYDMVFWISGDESTADETFSHQEQVLVKKYLETGGKLFVSGSEIGWDLSYKGDAIDKDFYKNYLKSVFVSDDAGSNRAQGISNCALSDCEFYFGQTYEEDYPDEILPTNGSIQCMQYANGKGAGNQYAGVFGASSIDAKLIYLSFPLETIADDSAFNKVIKKAVQFFQSISSITSEEINSAQSFSLEQNFPNPFNPETKIKFTVAQEQMVIIKVYDFLGNEIETLLNEFRQPGTYTVSFSPKNISTGVYFYHSNLGGNRQTRKMIFIK